LRVALLRVTDAGTVYAVPPGQVAELAPIGGLFLDNGTNTVSLDETNWLSSGQNRVVAGTSSGILEAAVITDNTNRLAFFGGFAAALSLGFSVLALRYFKRTTGMGD